MTATFHVGDAIEVMGNPVGFLVYGEFIPFDIWVKHLPFAAPVDQVVALYAADAFHRRAECPTCRDKGWIWSDDRPNYGEQRTCPTCNEGVMK